jgi:hypothetical protein
MRWLVAAAFLAFGALGQAQAAGCEHITNAFAYNECLSKQSAPKARSFSRGRGGDPEASVVERRGRGARRAARGGRYEGGNGMSGGGGHGMLISRSGGRVRATIDPWSGMRGTGAGKKRRR